MNISTRLFDGLYNIERSPDRVPHTCMQDRIPFFFSFSLLFAILLGWSVCGEGKYIYRKRRWGAIVHCWSIRQTINNDGLPFAVIPCGAARDGRNKRRQRPRIYQTHIQTVSPSYIVGVQTCCVISGSAILYTLENKSIYIHTAEEEEDGAGLGLFFSS